MGDAAYEAALLVGRADRCLRRRLVDELVSPPDRAKAVHRRGIAALLLVRVLTNIRFGQVG